MTAKQLALNIDGLRAGLLGGSPMDAAYMAGVNARARMLAKAVAVKPPPAPVQSPPFLAEVTAGK